jgi:hypothetical protein
VCLRITCVVYSDVCVCVVQGEGNITVQLSVVGFVLVCERQWMGVRYGNGKCWDCLNGVM